MPMICINGSTDRDAVWAEDSGGPKEPCVVAPSHPFVKGQFLEERTCPAMPDDSLPSAGQKRLNRSRCHFRL